LFEAFYKQDTVSRLIPEELAAALGLPFPIRFSEDSEKIRLSRFDNGHQGLRIELWPSPCCKDPGFVLELVFSHLGQVEMAWIVINDLTGERFAVDSSGRLPLAPNSGARNVREEARALKAGLSPNQVLRGLHLLGPCLAAVENFASAVGSNLLTVYAMAYHNALEYEHKGFNYRDGRELMEELDAGFAKGGRLQEQLDDSSVFRQRVFAESARGRSWAIHDGLEGVNWFAPQMFKIVGIESKVDTAPGIVW